jgi:uncharacterized membrane protein YoaK (UPF0700 family)
MIAGYIDAYGFLTFRMYLSFMSGNITQTGLVTGQGNVAGAVPALLPVVFFVIGVFTGTLLTHFGTPLTLSTPVRWGGGMAKGRRLVFGMVAALLALSIGISQFDTLPSGFGIATLSLAMGVMNTALSHVGAQSVSLTFMTGTLNNMASHLALAIKRVPLQDMQGPWDTHRSRVVLLTGIGASFLIGALLAGAATSLFGVWVLLLPLIILLTLTSFSRA